VVGLVGGWVRERGREKGGGRGRGEGGKEGEGATGKGGRPCEWKW